MYDHIFYKQVQISRSDIRPHIKWAVSLVILHMVTSISLQGLCGYIWVNILTLSPQRVNSNQDSPFCHKEWPFRVSFISVIWSPDMHHPLITSEYQYSPPHKYVTYTIWNIINCVVVAAKQTDLSHGTTDLFTFLFSTRHISL